MKPIFTALSPNVEWEDIKETFSILCNPFTWKNDQTVRDLEKWFIHFLSLPYAFAFESGRTCLYELLASQNIKTGDEVLVQAYTCVAVPNPILWTGAKPIYVDCDDSLTMSTDDLERKITPRSRALIVQHTFGQPARIDELLDIAREHHLFVIEDCAHALGANYHGRPVGSFGDASFFSFGRDKVLSSVFGGMVVTRHTAVAEHLSKQQERHPYPASSWVVQHLLHPIICEMAKRSYAIGIGKLILLLGRRTRLISLPVEPQERQGERASFLFHRFSPALARLALLQTKKLDRFNKHRQICALLYANALKNSRFRLPEPIDGTDPIFLRYAIRHPERERIIQEAKRQNIFLGDWYATPIAPTHVNLERICYRPCANAETFAKETLNLPTDIHITGTDVKRILSILQPYL